MSVQNQTSRRISLKQNDPAWRLGRAAGIVCYNTGEAKKFLILRRRLVIVDSTRLAPAFVRWIPVRYPGKRVKAEKPEPAFRFNRNGT